ncbi:MAG: EAL domain-containing protein [Sulfurovum sp.]|nr:EAL domain-containing protein [Sulfurovum sp.]
MLDISADLIEQPTIILAETYEVIFVNNEFQKYIEAKKGDSLKKVSSFPLVQIKGDWASLANIIQMRLERADGDTLYINNVLVTVDEKSKPVNIKITGYKIDQKMPYIGLVIYDIADKLELSKLHYQNATTGLPNHNKAMADIGLMVNKMLSKEKKFAVALISIDNFLEIISVVGYHRSLIKVSLIAKYLQDVSIRQGLSLYHMTSNNFLLLLPEIKSTQEGVALIDRYKTDCENLLHSKNNDLHFSISSGISIYPDNDTENLINGAYRALLLANNQGAGCTIVVKPDKDTTKAERLVEYKEIKKALENDQFSIYYQPIYNTESNLIAGAEALVRWIHPDKGVIPPGHFLPLVEKTGFMKQLSTQIAIKVITQLHTWKAHGFKKIQVSVNLSMREFEAGDFHDIIYTLLEKNNIGSSQLKIEITENIAMFNENYTLDQFTKLKEIGIDISLDDFGIGYSSFSMLRALPVDTIKLDRSFVTDMIFNKDHYSIVKAMIAVAHSLDLKVVAEGIEDMQTASMLKDLDCDYLQGYYLGKPMPVFEFQELIRSDMQLSKTDDIILID